MLKTLTHSSATLFLMALSGTVYAHAEAGIAGGLVSGLLHPVNGLDHLLAMVAVGLWGAQLGKPSIWLLPIVFPLVMAMGGLLGIANVPIPAFEMGIALSVLAMGAVILLCIRPPIWLSSVLVGAFAIFHGYAHGLELPQSSNPLAYGLGFVIATGCLHLIGILIGVLQSSSLGAKFIRILGAGITLAGAYFVVTIFS